MARKPGRGSKKSGSKGGSLLLAAVGAAVLGIGVVLTGNGGDPDGAPAPDVPGAVVEVSLHENGARAGSGALWRA